jgi:hypothetical protein
MRKGLGKGKGKGYKNIVGKDPRVHSQSARGIKQPQKLKKGMFVVNKRTNVRGKVVKTEPYFAVKTFTTEGKVIHQRISNQRFWDKDMDGDGKPDKIDCQPFNPKKQEKEPTKFEKVKGRVGAVALRGVEGGKELAVKGIKTLKEKKEEKRIKELEEIKHPLIKDLEKQKERVAQIQKHIQATDDEEKEEKLFDELGEEQQQLRQKQEKVTKLTIQDLSDRQLKTLAIRWEDTSIFGSDNPYKKELKRRIRAEKEIEKELDEVRKEKPEPSIFDF